MQRKYQQKRQIPCNNLTGLKKTPELHSKTYSFKDPLFESFGNGYVNKHNLYQSQNQIEINSQLRENYRQTQSQVLEEMAAVSDRVMLLRNMLNISRPICIPSILLVNTQNKIKTETIVKSKIKNQDEDSKIMCQNAKKYLKFLEIINIQDRKYLSSAAGTQKKQDVTINLESRIQNQSPTYFTNEPDSANLKHSFAYQSRLPSDEGSSQLFQQRHSSKIQQNSFNGEQSKYLFSYKKASQVTYNSQTTEQMFQKIQTPRMLQNQSDQSKYFSPNQKINPSQASQNCKLESRKFKKFQQSPPSSAVLQTKKMITEKSLTPKSHIHNQNLQKDNGVKQKQILYKNSSFSRHSFQISTQKNQNPTATNKNKGLKSKNPKEKGQQKITIGKDNRLSRNLAFKVVDKTNQFQKMLKMASSRINPA